MRLPSMLAIVALCSPAQAEPQPDNAAILKAIQGLSGRLDGLQKQIDDLKSKRPAATPPKAAATARMQTVPGWQVLVLNSPEDDPTTAPAIFAGPLSDFNFGLHTKVLGGRNQFTYVGQAFFHASGDDPTAAERYVFLATVEPIGHQHTLSNWQWNCAINLMVQDRMLLNGRTNLHQSLMDRFGSSGENVSPQTYSGAVDLKPGDYPISFKANCWFDGMAQDAVLDEGFPVWQRNHFRIQVRTPDDSAPRAFRADELFHVVKTKG